MKPLALVLLILNVAGLYWLYTDRVTEIVRQADTRAAIPADAPTLTLLAELDHIPPLKVPDPESGPVLNNAAEIFGEVVGTDLCVSIGPFADATARDEFRGWLRNYVAELKMRVEQVRERQFFWVYLEPTSAEDASRHIDDLQNRGFTDYMLIRRGNLKNAISLGLFRSQDSVNRRLAELSEKGYSPVVVPRFETSDRYWLIGRLGEAHQDSFDATDELPAGVTASPIGCEAI
jgi:hypothetical protein